MHRYSTDESRLVVQGTLVGLSVLIVWILGQVLAPFGLPWFLSVPSFSAFYGLGFTIFDRYLWSKPLVQLLGLCRVPDFSGSYSGQLTSSVSPDAQIDVGLSVRQTWTQIDVLLTTSTSESRSFMANVSGDRARARLSYGYANSVYPGIADAAMKDHLGLMELRLEAGDLVAGRYYSSRPSEGTIVFG